VNRMAGKLDLYIITIFYISLSLTLCALPACSAAHTRSGSTALSQDSGAEIVLRDVEYEQVFDAARSVLISYRFPLDRIDARRGVLTTHPKRTNGLASPWDREQSSLGQEFEDLVNEHRRVIRVELDRAQARGDITVRFTAEVLRTHRPNWRVQSESVRLSTHARERDDLGRLKPGTTSEIIGLDPELAQRMADALYARLGSAQLVQGAAERGAGED